MHAFCTEIGDKRNMFCAYFFFSFRSFCSKMFSRRLGIAKLKRCKSRSTRMNVAIKLSNSKLIRNDFFDWILIGRN